MSESETSDFFRKMPVFIKTFLRTVSQIKICAKITYMIWGRPNSVIPTASSDAVVGHRVQAVAVHSGVGMLTAYSTFMVLVISFPAHFIMP